MNLPFNLFDFDEVYSTSDLLTYVIDEELHDDSFVKRVMPVIRFATQKLSNSLAQMSNSQLSLKLADKDCCREAAFNGLRSYFLASLCLPDEAKRDAALKLNELTKRTCNSLYNNNYVIETPRLRDYISELDNYAYKSAIDKISANPWLTILKNAQKEFESVSLKIKQVEPKNNYNSVKKAKVNIEKYMEPLINYIIVSAESEPDKYKRVAEKIDQIICDATTVARARKVMKAKRENNFKEILY